MTELDAHNTVRKTGGLNTFVAVDGDACLVGATTFDDDSAISPGFLSRRARGTQAAQLTVEADDALACFIGRGNVGGAWSSGNRATMKFLAAEQWASGAQGTYARFDMTAPGGTTTAEVLRLLGAQKEARFSGPVRMAVYADATARDAAITAPTAGMVVWRTDLTSLQVYSGSAWETVTSV